MKSIQKIDPFNLSIRKTNLGILTTLQAEHEVSAKESISMGSQTLLASYVYREDETYGVVYTIIDTDGKGESFMETEGILPSLFLSPQGENYVSVVPYHPDKELEISIPIFNRVDRMLPKGNRPFVGDFVGCANPYSLFYDVDSWSDSKPDKMLAIEFKNNIITKKHTLKIPFPRNNKVFVDHDEIHLLARAGELLMHRQIDASGNLVRERTFKSNHKFFWQILSLSFDDHSYILCEENGKISIEVISPDLTGETFPLIDIGDGFYNTWQPVKIAENTFITQFNGEFGNGWLTTSGHKLVELFYNKGGQGYTNLLTNDVLEMDKKDWVISSVNSSAENSYAIVFYSRNEGQEKNKEICVLNRFIHPTCFL